MDDTVIMPSKCLDFLPMKRMASLITDEESDNKADDESDNKAEAN